MSLNAKIRFALDVAAVMNVAMDTGQITGVEIVEALQIVLDSAKHANQKILENPPAGIASAIRVVYGDTKGQA